MSLYIMNNILTGVWASGDFYMKPITFRNYNLILNWSFYELKLEIFGEKCDLEMIKNFYEILWNYGEWGENFIKPLIWMEIQTKYKYIKSKKYIEINDFDNYIDDYFKITLYFEPLIDGNPFAKDYIESNSYWINCIGGLYHVVDINWYIDTDNGLISSEKYIW